MLNASNYLFTGTITINKGVKLSIEQTNITFNPNTKIILKSNAKLVIYKSYLHACNVMWDGIYTGNNSKIILENNTIEDAKRVVCDTLGANQLYIVNNIFNKNYEGVILKSPNTTASLTFDKNLFTNSVLPSAYLVANPLYWATSITPAAISLLATTTMLPPYNTALKPYSGITLYQTRTPSNPNQYVQIDIYNLFNRLQFGIIATRSSFLVQNNEFQNMNSTSIGFTEAGIFVYGQTSPSFLSYDVKIGGTVAQANTFTNCKTGVLNQYATLLTIRNNNFKANTTGILVYRNNRNKLITIDRNKINQTKLGILCYDNQRADVQITENTLVNTSPVGLYNSNTAINTTEVTFPAGTPSLYAKYNVYNNSITGYYNGIYATNTFSTQVTDNEIHLTPDNTAGHFQFGIRYENTNLVRIYNNNVDKPSADNSAWWQYGIFGNTNTTPYVHCNGVDNFYASLKFQGLNITTGPGILGNVMNHGQIGIWLDASAEIGDQYLPFFSSGFASDNQWFGFSSTNPQTYSSGGSNIIGGVGAKMFTKGAGGGAYYLNNLNATIFPDGSKRLVGDYTKPSLNINCNAGVPTPLRLVQRATNLATNTMGYYANINNLNAIGARQLLHNIKLNAINISTDAVLQNFVATSYTTHIGQFYKVDSLINNALSTGTTADLSNASTLNTSISNTCSIIYNKQFLNNTYIALQSAEPDSTTLADLRVLAQKCPNLDGDAVFQARAILLYYDAKTYVSICDEQAIPPAFASGSRLANTTNQTEEHKELSLYPNPTTKDITVEYTKGDDNEAAELVVYNQLGELVLSIQLHDNKTIIPLTNLSAGVYLYTIKQQGITLKTNKLIITK